MINLPSAMVSDDGRRRDEGCSSQRSAMSATKAWNAGTSFSDTEPRLASSTTTWTKDTPSVAAGGSCS